MTRGTIGTAQHRCDETCCSVTRSSTVEGARRRTNCCRARKVGVASIALCLIATAPLAHSLERQERSNIPFQKRPATPQLQYDYEFDVEWEVAPLQDAWFGWTEFSTSDCVGEPLGEWEIIDAPAHGEVIADIKYADPGGACGGIEMPYAAVIYRWTASYEEYVASSGQDLFSALWHEDNADIFYRFHIDLLPPKISIENADLTDADSEIVVKAEKVVLYEGTPYQETYDYEGKITVRVEGSGNTIEKEVQDGASVAAGSYEVDLDRPSIVPDTYTNVIATWDTEWSQIEGERFNLSPAWMVIGNTRHTHYNSPHESECPGGNEVAYIANSPEDCTYQPGILNARFMSQVILNGTGLSINDGLVKSTAATLCKGQYPPLGNRTNSFVKVNVADGACLEELDTSMVAVSPNPTGSESIVRCDDTAAIVTSADANQAIKTVQDACPGCSLEPGSAKVDNFTFDVRCSGRLIGDYGTSYWTAFLVASSTVVGAVTVPVEASSSALLGGGNSTIASDGHVQGFASLAEDGISISVSLGDGALALAVNRSGRSFLIDVPNEYIGVDSMKLIAPDNVLILGRLGMALIDVSVLDLRRGTFGKNLWAFKPTISPDGKMIAFVRAYPEHGIDDVEDQVRLLATESLRTGSYSTSGNIDLGIPILPDKGKDGSVRDNINIDVEDEHHIASDFFWSADSDQFVFAEMSGGDLNLVRVDLSEGIPIAPSVSKYRIPEDEQVCLDRCGRRYVSDIEFGFGGDIGFLVKNRDVANVEQKFTVSLSQFEMAE